MHKGVLSDEYIRKQNPAFFFDTFKTRKPRVKKSLMPYYDLYNVAQVTQQNVYAVASDMVLNYTPPPEIPPPPPVDPFSPSFSSPTSTVDGTPRYLPFDPNHNPNLDELPAAPSFGYLSFEPAKTTTPSVAKALQRAMRKLEIDAIGEMSTPDVRNVFTQHKGMIEENYEDID